MKRSTQKRFSLTLISALLFMSGDALARTERIRWIHPDATSIDFYLVHTGPSSRSYDQEFRVEGPPTDAEGAMYIDLEVPDNDTIYVALTAHSGGVASFLSNEGVRAAAGADPGGSTPPPDPGGTSGGAQSAIEYFVLWDAQSDTVLDSDFTSGETIALSTHSCTAIEPVGNAYLATRSTPGSVYMNFDGRDDGSCNDRGVDYENNPPYAWQNTTGSTVADGFECAPTLTEVGTHTLVVTPYDGDDCSGPAGATRSITFEIVETGGGSTTPSETTVGQPGRPVIVTD